MYEKNADIMSSLAGAKDSVSKGALSLLAKLKGSSANDGVAALPPEAQQAVSEGVAALPNSARQTVDSLRDKPMGGLADKATKALSDMGGKVGDKAEKALADVNAPSGLSYIPGIGGYLSGLLRPAPGRGRFVSSVGEGVSGNLGGVAGGAAGVVGGATLGGVGALLAALLSKGKLNLGEAGILGGGLAGGITGNSLGTHAGAGLFHDLATKQQKSAELTGNQEELDVNNNDKIEAADLAALRKRKKPVKSAELIGSQEEIDVNDNGKIEAADLAALRKGKKPSKDKPKIAEWTPVPTPTFSADMTLPEKKPNPFVPGKKPSAKADASLSLIHI